MKGTTGKRFFAQQNTTSSTNLKIQDTKVRFSFLHFPPSITPKLHDTKVVVNDDISILLTGYKDVTISKYQCPSGFNKLTTAYKLESKVDNISKMEIVYEN